MELQPDTGVNRVSTRSSIRDRVGKHSSRKPVRPDRSHRIPTPETSDVSGGSEEESNHDPPIVTPPPVAQSGKGVGLPNPLPDISQEVRAQISIDRVEPPARKVTFTGSPVTIHSNQGIRVDEYDILQDLRAQKANVTIGQLLHDNPNYQKQLKDSLIRPRRRRIKLPPVAVNFAEVEDFGAPEISVEIDGCLIRNVPVDGGSGVNLMLESTASDLGYVNLETTEQTLRMADQSRVVPAGKLSGIPTLICGTTYPLNYIVIRVGLGKPFPLLLGRPWLYLAGVKVNWERKAFVFGNPPVSIPWLPEKHQGETSESDGYTSDWTDPDETDSVPSYRIEQYNQDMESDFDFPEPVPEEGVVKPESDPEDVPGRRPEDRSLGESDALLSLEWIRQQMKDQTIPPVPCSSTSRPVTWADLYTKVDVDEAEKIKTVVAPDDYEAVEVEVGKTFYLGRRLSKKERKDYMALLKEFLDVFAWSPADLRGIPPELGEHAIDLKEDSIPVRQRQYRLNPKYSLMVKEELDKLLEAGIIYPVNNSEWVSPIVVVPKKVGADGKVKIRVCQDFRKLNAATRKDHFPLPFIDMVLDHVAGQECFSFLDGFSGYNQVFIRKNDQLKTTFTTDWGTFAFNRMPFGLCNAPGTFQRLMTDIFRDFLKHFLEVFMDDFAVFSKWVDHLTYLRKTFQRCRDTNLKLHPGKCFFGMMSGLLLGHIVSKRGLEVNLDKVKVILTLLPPKNVREIRGFLGCVGYYRRFIVNYARLASPLTELLKKEVEYLWTEIRQQAFEDLKKKLATAPILAPPDWSKAFHVTLDASGWCLGAILWQADKEGREHPIYYASRQMSPAEKNYTATEREALAVIYACKKFRHYLLGYEVIFHTDHDALKYLVNKPDLSGRLARWILLLQEFTYVVVVKSGKSNSNADYLSRQRGLESSTNLPAEFPDEFPEEYPVVPEAKLPELPEEDVPVYQVEDTGGSDFQGIIEYLQTGRYPAHLNREEKSVFQHQVAPYCLIKGILFRMGADDKLRRCLEKEYRGQVIRALHDAPAGGHFAAVSTMARIREAGYWWPHLNRDVKGFVRSCDPCQRTGAPSFRHHWPLTPIVPLAPFAKWGIDFIGPIFPVGSGRHRYIVLATDYATKWVEARATKRNDATTAATFLFEQILMRFGYPLELVSDRGTHFLNDTIEQITELYHIKHRKTTPYNPKANGLTERANGIVGNILNKVVSAHKIDWDIKLYSAVFAYNTTWKKTTGRTPYFLVYGMDVLQEIEMDVETYRVIAQEFGERTEDIEERLSQIDQLEEYRRDSLDRTRAIQNQRKEDFDRKLPRETGIREGKLVLLFDNRHKDFPGKLQTRWMGPYRVIKIFGNGSLQLEQLDGTPLDTRTNGSRVKLYNPAELD